MTMSGRPGETADQRDDRNLADLLQELRVATLGVQVLFGFLLALPFTTRFSRLAPWQHWLYLGVILVSSISIILLVAPVAFHRLLFRRHQLGYLIDTASKLAICGLVTVGLAVSGAVLLVTSYVEPGLAAVLSVAVTGGLVIVLWFGLPLARRRKAPPPSRHGSGSGSQEVGR